MKTTLIMAALAIAAAGAGAYGWLQHQEHAQTRSALSAASSELQKSRAELKTAVDELSALRKQLSEQQMALNQLQAETTNARAFVEAEKAVSVRLRQEIAKMKEDQAGALRTGKRSVR